MTPHSAQSHYSFASLMQRLQAFPASQPMPVLFVGHGNPMNAIESNVFTQSWQRLGKALPQPKAILSVSAHWLTQGSTEVLAVEKPKTIHDFSGFPETLFAQSYPSLGAPEFAQQTLDLLEQRGDLLRVHSNHDWGLDHGTWSVLMQMFPQANIPVYQISLDYRQPPQFHYALAKQLKALRHKGVMVMASGNIVHNLSKLQWDKSPPYDWAQAFHSQVKSALSERNDQKLIDFDGFGALGKLAHPHYDHYLPLLYSLGLRQKDDDIFFFNDGFDLGSISMLSFVYLPTDLVSSVSP